MIAFVLITNSLVWKVVDTDLLFLQPRSTVQILAVYHVSECKPGRVVLQDSVLMIFGSFPSLW